MADMVRINTRISAGLNDWLDKVTKEEGIAKSTLIMISIEQFRQQKEAMQGITSIMERLQEIENKLK